MPTPVLLTLAAVLAVSVGTSQANVTVRKCCNEFKMLSGDGRTCVDADWPRNVSIHMSGPSIVPPLDEWWLRHWIPPGIPMHSISRVVTYGSYIIRFSSYNVSVNSSSLWDEKTFPNAVMSRNRVVFRRDSIVRPKPGGLRQVLRYCVDAALPPLPPFVLLLDMLCNKDECATKCCDYGEWLVGQGDNWDCEPGGRSVWHPENASFAKDIDPEFPFQVSSHCTRLRQGAPEDRLARWARSMYRVNLFSNWKPCFDYYRSAGGVEEGLFYCEYPRVARGMYWLLRPLCVVSSLLLTCSLGAIACDRIMRRKAHGWCLAIHASCLLAFNLGQVLYYVAISDAIDGQRKMTRGVWKMCRYLAFAMYFVLTASWFWLTALCMNMATGFRLLAAHRKRSERNKFLALSTFAWGFSLLLTVTCSLLFTSRAVIDRKRDASWYKPTLMETRVCYTEPIVGKFLVSEAGSFSVKRGTAIFYYGPVLCLVVCNIVCLALTLKKVQYLKRGNSILRRDEQRNRLAGENNCRAGDTEAATARTRGSGNEGGSRTAVDAKTIKLYIKMLLMTGTVELITETIVWTTTSFSNDYPVGSDDYHFHYRASGHVTDFFRAACVAWLAAPEGGYLSPLLRRLRGQKIRKSKKRG